MGETGNRGDTGNMGQQTTGRRNLRVVHNPELDPATADARRRIVRPQPKPRSRFEPSAIVVIVVIASITLALGYLGGRNNTLFATAATLELDDLDDLDDSLTSDEAPAPATTQAPAPQTTVERVIAPPSLEDDFDRDFDRDFDGAPDGDGATLPETASTIAPPPAEIEPETTSLTVEESGALAAGIAQALTSVEGDEPALATGSVVDVATEVGASDVATDVATDAATDVDTATDGDAAALESTNEFIALSTEVFGSGGPRVVALDAEGDAFEIDGSVQFEYKSRVIVDSYLPFLDGMVTLMERRPNLTLVVFGHTDARGDAVKNLELSKARAESVVAYLMFRGIDEERLTAIGRGETEPVANNDTEAGRELNRRIQLVLDRLVD